METRTPHTAAEFKEALEAMEHLIENFDKKDKLCKVLEGQLERSEGEINQ